MNNRSIGIAKMEADGTLVLQLRAEGADGLKGDSQFFYPQSHPKYEEMLKHIGGLKPGQKKEVPPFP